MILNYFVSDELYAQRLAACKPCENYGSLGMCSKCNCIMPVKAKFAQFECPIKIWPRDYAKLVVQPPAQE